MIQLPWLDADTPFPPASEALVEPNGLLAVGGDLSVERILAAYRGGIYPWFSPGEPILWWSPDPRLVLKPEEIHITRSFSKILRNRPYEVRFDTSFETVMRACAEPREPGGGTWISEEMIAAYVALHQAGYAHSVETWVDNQLVGGLYGMAIGRMFFGESMFSRAADASKIALTYLCEVLNKHGYPLVDCQMHTPHLARMGAVLMPRNAFCAEVERLVAETPMIGKWDFRFINTPF